MTEADALKRIEEYVARDGTAKAFAERCGISTMYLCDIRKGRRRIPDKVLKQIGLEFVPEYREILKSRV